MDSLNRRGLFRLGLAATAAGLVPAVNTANPAAAQGQRVDLLQQLLELAAVQQDRRRAQFAAIQAAGELDNLQDSLRRSFVRLLGGLPERAGAPPVTKTGQVDGDDYVIEKLAYESFPGYFVTALLYRPREVKGRLPGVLSPCGHSDVGKAAGPYQVLHVNLAKRGYVVLTYDPVGQGERSQFWDAQKGRSRFNLVCGEHAVLGNPLYLLGLSLARFRIWDGLCGIDYLVTRPEVDPAKIGCVGNSGGGTLTAYLAALDPRIAVAAPCCYITTLPRRMANRIQADPDSDPEQDIAGFVRDGIDHAGLLALRVPRPTLLGTARLDFFPIEGARETFAEVQRLYQVAGAPDRIERAEADARHGLSAPLRLAVYGWFDRWLAGRPLADAPVVEAAVRPRPAAELKVCADGQANLTLRSRPLLPMALEEFRAGPKPPRIPLRDLIGLDPDGASPVVSELGAGTGTDRTLVVCVNGNEGPDWRGQAAFLKALEQAGHAVAVVDPRGVGTQRPDLAVRGHDYTDPLCGVEENLAYNAFLVGRSLVGLRASDVVAAVRTLAARTKPRRVVLCARRDAALVACFAAAVEPAIDGVAAEEMRRSFLSLFSAEGEPINAASIVPNLLRDFGDLPDVLAQVAPRKVLVAAGIGETAAGLPSVQVTNDRFTADPAVLTEWLRGVAGP